MNGDPTEIHAGLSGITLEVDSFELGHGVVLSRTYAHLMAPFMMAFAPAPPGKPHPAPWSAVSGGFGFDFAAQLKVPGDINVGLPLDSWGAAWCIVALLRLRTGPYMVVPAFSSYPFAEARTLGDKVRFWPYEVEPHNVFPVARPKVTEDDLAWVKRHWVSTASLMEKHVEFSTCLEAIDQCAFARRESLALLWLWGSLEALFSGGRDELRYRVSTSIATFLEPPGLGRMSLQRDLVKLYDSRSAAAHGRRERKPASPLAETYAVLSRAITKMIEDNHVPTKAELEAKLFGADPS